MACRFCMLLSCFMLIGGSLCAQFPASHHYSTEADIGHPPCLDTLHVLSYKRGYDVGIILPSWGAVINNDYVAVIEGTVHHNPANGTECTHVSHEDLPFYHYTHDMCVDIVPDATPDGRYTNLLPYLVTLHPNGVSDTTLQTTLGIEWECGIGADNKCNPCTANNNIGKSSGGCTGGHEKGDIIWQWPTPGDWVHAEGHYVWDRGHPPANCEIHPARFMATRRNLPAKIKVLDGTDKYATRMDIYASGDGGALHNNRNNALPFTLPVKMSGKDYQVIYKPNLSKPVPNAVLMFVVEKHKGDTYPIDETITANPDGAITVTIPWQSANIADTAIYGRTIYAYWNQGTGTADTIDEYHVNLDELYLKKLSELGDRAEIRLFANVGNDWIFLNDFHGRHNKILTAGLGKTFKKHWKLNNQFTVYVPRKSSFRVYMSGWEADGVDFLMGTIINPATLCNNNTRKFFRKKFFSIKNMLLRGCEDDELAETSALQKYPAGISPTTITIAPTEGRNQDPCPFSKYPLKNRYFLTYTFSQVGK